MIRRLQIRRENTLLLVAMRISYGGTILSLMAANASTSGALLNQIAVHGGLGGVMLGTLSLSAALLISDGLFEFAWPYIADRRAEQVCARSRWLRKSWLSTLRRVLVAGCALANRYRHWFYLPPAFACLFVVPVSVYIGAEGRAVLTFLYVWLFACGIGGALMDAISGKGRGKVVLRVGAQD